MLKQTFLHLRVFLVALIAGFLVVACRLVLPEPFGAVAGCTMLGACMASAHLGSRDKE